MSDELVVGYRTLPARAGLRIWADGAVELSTGGDGWRHVCTLDARTVEQVASRTIAAGIPELPAEVPPPTGVRDGSSCEWTTDLGGGRVVGTIHAWSDRNPAAAASRALALHLSAVVSAAVV